MTVEGKSSSDDNTHINTFKHRLDKYWFDQDVKYNYNADLHVMMMNSFHSKVIYHAYTTNTINLHTKFEMSSFIHCKHDGDQV